MCVVPAVQWSDGLDKASRRIAEIDASPLRVLAGPGTGKTTLLIRRVMRLLQNGADPSRIMLCTFTRTAAQDLQKKLGRLGVPEAQKTYADTLHSFCFSLLSKAEVFPLTGRVPRPLLEFEERFLLEDLKGTNNEGLRDLRERLSAFSAAWARQQNDDPGWPENAQDRKFLSALQAWLEFHECMLIGELIPEGLRFIRNNPVSPYRPSFDHVIIDEYQDLNRAEQALLDAIAVDGTITVAGDEDQSIYSFKHAYPEGIAGFHRTHEGTHDESLDRCRRCPQTIVSMANSLISYNPTRSERALCTSEENPDGDVFVVQWPLVDEEAHGLATFVARQIEIGQVEPGQVLVLAPRRQLGYMIRDALRQSGVAAYSFFHEEALEGNPNRAGKYAPQESFTLLTLLVRPEDRVALRCWCGFGSPSLRTGAWNQVRQHSEVSGDAPRLVLEHLRNGHLQLRHSKDLAERFALLQERLDALQGLQGSDLVDVLFPEGESWADPFRTIAEVLGDDGTPAQLLDLLHRGATQPELPMDVDYVRVMSLHKSKGLTANLVIVSSCIDGLIPSIPENSTPEVKHRALEEQRRLFYVAVTRARRTLVLSSVIGIDRADAYRMRARVGSGHPIAQTVASPFLNELGPDCPAAMSGSRLLQLLIE